MDSDGGFCALLFITLLFILSPWGANDTEPAEMEAAAVFCKNHGGVNHINNEYVREVVCVDGLEVSLAWVMRTYPRTP